MESEASIVNDIVNGVNHGYSGDQREEIRGKEIEKFRAEKGKGAGS